MVLTAMKAVMAAVLSGVLLTGAGCGTGSDADRPAPESYMERWCLDPATQELLDDDLCDADLDEDGWVDVTIVYPLPGHSRPPVGSKVHAGWVQVAPSRKSSTVTRSPTPRPTAGAPVRTPGAKTSARQR